MWIVARPDAQCTYLDYSPYTRRACMAVTPFGKMRQHYQSMNNLEFVRTKGDEPPCNHPFRFLNIKQPCQ